MLESVNSVPMSSILYKCTKHHAAPKRFKHGVGKGLPATASARITEAKSHHFRPPIRIVELIVESQSACCSKALGARF